MYKPPTQRIIASSMNKKPKGFVNNDSDFPQLESDKDKKEKVCEKDREKEDNVCQKLNFLDASLKEIEVDNTLLVDKPLPNGWISLHHINNKTEIVDNSSTNSDENCDYDYNYEAYINIDNMISNWDAYRTHYCEVYGEDEYAQLYLMPESFYEMAELFEFEN